MAIAPFPHRYSVALDDSHLSSGTRAPLPIGPPPQFGGVEPLDWSPEDLLVGAVVSCLKTTFDAYARRATLAMTGFRATAEGVLEKTREGPAFSSISIHVELTVHAGDEQRAKELLAHAERDCIISRAIKAPVTLTVDVRATGAMVAAAE